LDFVNQRDWEWDFERRGDWKGKKGERGEEVCERKEARVEEKRNKKDRGKLLRNCY
jgi:hypothetical protein